MNEFYCVLCMVAWGLLALSVVGFQNSSDHIREEETLTFWREYDAKLRQLINSPYGSSERKRLETELTHMKPPIN